MKTLITFLLLFSSFNSSFAQQTTNPPQKHTSVLYYTKLVASVRAKEFCSCYFIVGQTKDFCLEQVKNGLPTIRMTINEGKKKVTFGVLPAVSAHVVSDRLGCVLE